MKVSKTNVVAFMPMLSFMFVILLGLIMKRTFPEIAKLSVLILILTGSVVFYIRKHDEKNLFENKIPQWTILICYLFSICLIMVFSNGMLHFWMIGSLVVSMLIDNKIGLLLHFNLTFLSGIAISLPPETIIYLLIMGVIITLVSDSLKHKSTVIYASIIILSTNITLAFLISNFIFDKERNGDYLLSLFSVVTILVVAYCIVRLFSYMEQRRNKENSLITDMAITTFGVTELANSSYDLNSDNNASDSLAYDLEVGTSYDLLIEDDNELLFKLKNYSEHLYRHSLRIGDLSYRAAKAIGCNDKLAKAGGLYHEIGKINGKNYIEEGITIATEYGFPRDLKAILRQHNIKYEKPTSVEAAIVMLSDNVISTVEYIDKSGEHKFTTDKIIDNIFQMRMEKGTFDESGLTVKDYKLLKDFYQKQFNSKEHKQEKGD